MRSAILFLAGTMIVPALFVLMFLLVLLTAATGEATASPGFPSICDLQMNPVYGGCVGPA